MKYYQEVRLFDSYDIKLRELYECKDQQYLTCDKLRRWGHLTDQKFRDLNSQMFVLNVCKLQDIILELLRGLIERCQNPTGRREIWNHIIMSIDNGKEIREELRRELNALPIEPMLY
jgi:hypothetical protein